MENRGLVVMMEDQSTIEMKKAYTLIGEVNKSGH